MTTKTPNYKFLERKLPDGYHDRLDDSLLAMFALVSGSHDVLINDEGKVVKRKGYQLFGQSGTSKKGVKTCYTWQTSTNTEITLRGVYDSIQAEYGGTYRTIASGYKTYYKFRYSPWWDKNEAKDKLLFVNGEATIKSWTGGMTEIASWTSTTISKKYAKESAIANSFVFNATTKTLTQTATDFVTLGFKMDDYVSVTGSVNNNAVFKIRTVTPNVMTFSEDDTIVTETVATAGCVVGVLGKQSWREERFAQTGTKTINIAGSIFNYTGGEATPTLTLTADPSSVATVGGFVFQPIANTTPTGGDIPANFPIDIIAVNINQAYVGSELFRNVYISKQSNFGDFAYTTSVRKPGEGGTITLDSNLVGIATSKEITYATAGNSDVYTISLDPFSDGTTAGVGEIIKVKKLATAYGQGGVSQESFVKAKNGILYLSNEPTIDFIGNIEQVAGQSVKPLSYDIKRLLNKIDRADAQGLYSQNYIIYTFPKASVIIMYDLERGRWQPPMYINASCMCTYKGKVLIHSDATDETYTLFTGLSDNGKPINAKAVYNIESSGTRTERKIYDEVFIEAIVNSNTNSVVCTIESGYKGAVGIHTFELSFNEDDRYAELQTTPSGVGTSPFGYSPFGGLLTNTTDDETIGVTKLIRKISQTSVTMESFNHQVSVTNEEIDAYFEIVCFGLNTRIATTSNMDIKE